MMQEYVAIGVGAALLAGIILQPRRYRKIRRPLTLCRPYLGEFIPAETPAEKEDRERWAKINELVGKG